MNRILSYISVFIGQAFLGMSGMLLAQPLFLPNQDPKPSDKEWVKIEQLSDEFDGVALDEIKWQNTDAKRWRGRAPGIFKQDVISLGDNNLRVTCYQLETPEIVSGDTFTHAGGNLYSKFPAQVGYYFECRMKANKTFMSSTFWLINNRGDGSGCDVRTTELDIQECVGQVTTTASWAQSFDASIHSNTHSRNTSCQNTPTGSEGGNAPTDKKVWADYHVYGAWWKSPTEIEFYLDGEKVYSVTPASEFNLPMYLRLVTETYNWNPVPADGGMTGTWEERTTYYDWVRSWELKEKLNTNVPEPVNPSINVFPNPATGGLLSVKLSKGAEPTPIKLRDVYGRLLKTQFTNQGEATIQLDGLSNGVYFIEIGKEGEKQLSKFWIL